MLSTFLVPNKVNAEKLQPQDEIALIEAQLKDTSKELTDLQNKEKDIFHAFSIFVSGLFGNRSHAEQVERLEQEIKDLNERKDILVKQQITAKVLSLNIDSLHKAEAERIKLQQEQQEQERLQAEEQARKEEEKRKQEQETGLPVIGSNGLLVESKTSRAQNVINLLIGIPGHRNGQQYHINHNLANLIDELTIAECVYVIHRIEGAGFGQTGDGYAGQDTPASHRNFLQRQVINRFGGSIKSLLKHWGTYSYGGY